MQEIFSKSMRFGLFLPQFFVSPFLQCRMNIVNDDLSVAFSTIHIVANLVGRACGTSQIAWVSRNLYRYNLTPQIVFAAGPPLFTLRTLAVKAQRSQIQLSHKRVNLMGFIFFRDFKELIFNYNLLFKTRERKSLIFIKIFYYQFLISFILQWFRFLQLLKLFL